MKEIPYSHTEHYLYTSKDADHLSHIKASALINYFIQIAWIHAEKLGMGYSHLQKENKAWVLSRFTLQLDEQEHWPGNVTLHTWPKRQERLFYLRDAQIIGQNNKHIGSITSSWLVIDIQSKRPKLINNVNDEVYNGIDAIEDETPLIKSSGEAEFIMDYTVRYNDIDVNHHLTTVRYLELLFDTYDLNFISQNPLKKMHVNFLKEVLFNTELRIKRFTIANTHTFEILDKKNEKCYFRGELHF